MLAYLRVVLPLCIIQAYFPGTKTFLPWNMATGTIQTPIDAT